MSQEQTPIQITKKQEQWLNSRGDRNKDDVLFDEKTLKPYVLMSNGRSKDVKIKVPNDEDICDQFQ